MASHQVEGPLMRELLGDVHSISILAYCDSAISFAVSLYDGGTHCWVSPLLNLPAATWALLTLPNIPLWLPAGNWTVNPGAIGYQLRICLGCGSTYQAPSTGWQNGNFLAPAGVTNFLSLASGKNFILGFVQHEPGPNCTALIDKPFSQNLDECLRYFQKTYDYASAIGTGTSNGCVLGADAAVSAVIQGLKFPKIMAKPPSMTAYNHQTGAANSIYDTNGGVARTVTGFGSVGTGAFNTVVATGIVASPSNFCYIHYTADTGW